MSNNVYLDGVSAIRLPLNDEFNQCIDTPIPAPLNGKSLAFVAVFSKSADGNVALGFVSDPSWGKNLAHANQRFFKLNGTDLFISRGYHSSDTDQDTGIDIKADALQGIMIKVAPDGGTAFFYQNGADKSPEAAAWREITPRELSSSHKLQAFDSTPGLIGVNSLQGSKGSIKIDYIGLFDLAGKAAPIIEDDFLPRPGVTRPNPRLKNTFPFGGSQGTVQDLTLLGENLEESYAGWFDAGSQVYSLGPSKSAVAPRITSETEGLLLEIKSVPDAQQVQARISIASNAREGEHRLRLVTPRGVTNAVSFWVSSNPVFLEADGERGTPTAAQSIPVPSSINGQISVTGESDYYSFQITEPRTLKFELARINGASPVLQGRGEGENYLFDPILKLYDINGSWLESGRPTRLMFYEEIACGMFPPNRTVNYTFSTPGQYLINVESMFGRGAPHFWYMLRITPASSPALPNDGLEIAQARIRQLQDRVFQPAPKAIPSKSFDEASSAAAASPGPADKAMETPSVIPPILTLGYTCETEPNDEPGTKSLQFSIPSLLEGMIGRGGDIDHYRFKAAAGQKLVFEIETPRASPPVFNPRIDVTDPDGKEVTTNLQFHASGAAIMTMVSKVVATFPRDSVYNLAVRDATTLIGGSEYFYRITIRPPIPALGPVHLAGDDCINLIRGVPRQVTIAMREEMVQIPETTYSPLEEGFTGDFAVKVDGLPEGVEALYGAGGSTMVILAGADAPLTALPRMVNISGRPVLDGRFGPQYHIQDVPVMVVP